MLLKIESPKKTTISGKNIVNGKTTSIEINSNEILPAIRDVLNKLLVSLNEVIEEAPSELVTDLANKGVAMSGGTALLKNIDIFLTKSLGLPCYIVEDPMSCVVKGLQKRIYN